MRTRSSRTVCAKLDELVCRVEAEQILNESDLEAVNGSAELIIITKIFSDRDADSLKHLAIALTAHPNVVAFLGSHDSSMARLVFARSPDAPGDMNVLMRSASEMIGGRGGGKPDLAQGGGKDITALDEAIEAALQAVNQR